MIVSEEYVAKADWHSVLAAKRDDGLTYLDFLAGVDRVHGVEVVAHVLDPATKGSCLLAVVTDTGHLDSIADLYPGAAWHERETADLFGLTFDGHPDPRPLVTPRAERAPLSKSTALPARVTTPWPGAEPGRRRASRPPGVLESWEEP